MRFLPVSFLLTVASIVVPGLTPESARARDQVIYVERFYYPAGPVYYSTPCRPVYFAPPTYSPPRTSYAQPMYSQQFYGYRPRVTVVEDRPDRPTTTVTVGLTDNRFEPATLTVAPGTTLRWTNNGRHKHTVTASDGRWDSGDLGPGQVYSATFTQPGTYEYFCRHHKEMRGSIVVK
jgi:plastocyanin